MHIDFVSSHVVHNQSADRLTVQIARENAIIQQTVNDAVYFSTPPNYHVHNDLVAAALMTLAGSAFTSASFNFPISAHCAATLRDYYRLDEIGPVDPALEPRRPGRHLGLNFSGGTDSTAVWLLLTRIEQPFKVVTTDYGGYFWRERLAFEHFQRDITCTTNFRRRGYWRNGGRFNSAVPLLFADYLDLEGIATGHNMLQNPLSIEHLRDGQQPAFIEMDKVVTAGGLAEVHLFRSLTMLGTMLILLHAGQHLIENAFAASEARRTWKYFGKAVLVRGLCARLGLPQPSFLDTLEGPVLDGSGGNVADQGWAMGAVAFAHRFDPSVVELLPPEVVAGFNLGVTDSIDAGWMERYNPSLIGLIPASFRNRFLDELHTLGIYPYTEFDWQQLEAVRQFVCLAMPHSDDVLPGMCS